MLLQQNLLKKVKQITIAILLPVLLGCGENNKKEMINTNNKLSPASIEPKTFQEIGFFGTIKKDRWDDFLKAVQNNIAHSRKEKGNLSFSLYQPEDGNLQPIWFERFENKKAHDIHMEQDYFKNAIQVIKKSLEGEAKSISLKVTDEIPAKIPSTKTTGKKTSHLIVLFDIESEKREIFLNIMTNVTEMHRKNQDNLEFNLYEFEDNPNKFVLIEGRVIKADDQEDKNNYLKALLFPMKDLYAADPINSSWFVKDISQ